MGSQVTEQAWGNAQDPKSFSDMAFQIWGSPALQKMYNPSQDLDTPGQYIIVFEKNLPFGSRVVRLWLVWAK